ncbi:hypothetical protein PLESTB_000571000 [Pleodorina starrii]|uniref:Uncharacterized protein n=1 Tax=Pleodorina starrii TaxID=330485 RepID=A0A9W6BH33_9CHLO|nr:hypothetical protein PLESTM_000313700 [Pleodorina starrii]GLC51994.1 hypothetical protein PLESTB_000571000 [Pleodorina starrii]
MGTQRWDGGDDVKNGPGSRGIQEQYNYFTYLLPVGTGGSGGGGTGSGTSWPRALSDARLDGMSCSTVTWRVGRQGSAGIGDSSATRTPRLSMAWVARNRPRRCTRPV